MRFIVISLAAFMAGCTAPDRSKQTLINSGYTEIEMRGYDPFSCGEDDTYSTKFTAKNPQGIRVSGTVCCGLIKSCTVRF